MFSFHFFVHLFTLLFLATAKKDVPKQNKASNKENVPANKSIHQPNRAILAVSIVNKKSQQTHNSNNNGNPPVKASNKSQPKHHQQQQQQKGILKKSTSVTSSATSIAKNINDKPKVLTKSVSTHKLLTTTDKLYEQAEIQKKRKEVLAKKLKAEEEKECKFKFTAKPVPKFVKVAPSLQAIISKQQITKQNTHEEKKKLVKQQSMPNISTVACKKSAPLVPSCGNPERIKAIMEHKKQLMDKYKPENIQFKAKPADVLQKTVFQPKHNFKAVDAKPFKLILTQRMMQRSTFDRQLQEALAIKEKQKEILQRQHDLEERKIMRQKTEFRARPNPFGRY